MSLIVTGTDTGVGKTLVSALVLLRYARLRPRYWKPVATGSDEGTDSGQISQWTAADVLPEAYTFQPPVSPHLAAEWAGITIRPTRIVRQFAAHDSGRPLVVEGIGGVLVPFHRRYFFADFARNLRLPVLVVARSTLGTINHTLLTLEALRRRRIRVIGVVLNGPANPDNRRAIEIMGRVPVIAEVGVMRAVTPGALSRAASRFDRRGVLRKHLA